MVAGLKKGGDLLVEKLPNAAPGAPPAEAVAEGASDQPKAVITHDLFPPGVAISSPPSTKTSGTRFGAAAGSKHPSTPGRKRKSKCHYCRNVFEDWRRCTYWNERGIQCRKVFCHACVEAHATLDEVQRESEADWHCPSCLGTCQCAACAKKRERDAKFQERGFRETSKRIRMSANVTLPY